MEELHTPWCKTGKNRKIVTKTRRAISVMKKQVHSQNDGRIMSTRFIFISWLSICPVCSVSVFSHAKAASQFGPVRPGRCFCFFPTEAPRFL